MSLQNLALIIFTSFLTATGNLLLRRSVTQIELLLGTTQQVLDTVWSLVFNKSFSLGIAFYIVATAMWIYVLSRQPIGLSYPTFVTCAFLFVTLGATFSLGETLTMHKLVGMGLMLAGIIYVSVTQ
jgi:multidrug transporter EmrE-like cation transporter